MWGKKSINLPTFLLIVLLVFLMGACRSSMTSPFVDSATNTILYCADRLDKNGVYIGGGVFVVEVDSSKVICLTDALENERMPYCDFDWLSVREQVVFASERADGARQIYSVNVDGSGLVNLSGSGDCGFYRPSWSPNGESIAFVCNNGIYTMQNDGTNLRRLHDYYATTPYWSPDSTRIAFGAIEDGEYVIYVIDADGSGLHQITHSRVNSLYLDWSPDGTRIAFRGTNNNIIVANADSSGEMWLTDNSAVDEYPNWSPDGSQIAFHSDRDGNWEIYVMNADGSRQTRLTHNSITDRGPEWSPDGMRIAFVSRDLLTERWEIYVMNADGSDRIALTSDSRVESHIHW